MNDVTKLVRPSMRCARVQYFLNMTHRTEFDSIPLGVFCEIKTSQMRALALRARTRLSDNEANSITPVFRDHIINPFQYLAKEFDAAWASADTSCALSFLTRKHSAALSVLAPYHPTAADRPWWQGLFGEPEVSSLLEQVIYAEFERLMDDVPPRDGPTKPSVLRVQLAKAA